MSSGEKRRAQGAGRPAAFLDRDGTIVVERQYLSDPDDVELVPGAAAAMDALAREGYAVVIVTNQSGIARGYYEEADFRAVQRRIEGLLQARGVRPDGVYHCPHHPEHTGPCRCRKPATGLFVRAANELDLDLERSVYIGDRLKDVEPTRSLGGTGVLVRTGYGADHAPRAPEDVHVADDLRSAVEHVLGRPVQRLGEPPPPA